MNGENPDGRPFWVLEDGVWLDNAPFNNDSIVISDSVIMGDVVQKIIIDDPDKIQQIIKKTLRAIGLSDGRLPDSTIRPEKGQLDNTISLADYISNSGLNFDGWTELSLGHACELKGDFESAESHFKKALEFAVDNNDERLQNHTELGFIILLISAERYNQAEERTVDLLDIFTKFKDDEGISNCRELLGLISYSRGRYGQSRMHHKKALEIRKSNGVKEAIISSKINLANVAMSEGKVSEAGTILHGLDSRYISKKDEAQLLCSKGVNELQNDNYHEAIDLLNRSLDIRKEISDRRGESESYNYIGTAKMLYGNIEQGYTDCETAYKIAREISNSNLMAHALYNMGQGSIGQSNIQLGRSELTLAVKLFQEVGNADGIKNCKKMLQDISDNPSNLNYSFIIFSIIIGILFAILII